MELNATHDSLSIPELAESAINNKPIHTRAEIVTLSQHGQLMLTELLMEFAKLVIDLLHNTGILSQIRGITHPSISLTVSEADAVW